MSFLINVNLAILFPCSKSPSGFTFKFEDGLRGSIQFCSCLPLKSPCLKLSPHSFYSSQNGFLVFLKQTNFVPTSGSLYLIFLCLDALLSDFHPLLLCNIQVSSHVSSGSCPDHLFPPSSSLSSYGTHSLQ